MSSKIQWGIGIEHEVMMIYGKREKVRGDEILANLNTPDYGLRDYIANFLCHNCQYEVTPVYNSIPANNVLIEYFSNHGISQKLGNLLEKFRNINKEYINLDNIQLLRLLFDQLHKDSTNVVSVYEIITVNWKKSVNSRFSK